MIAVMSRKRCEGFLSCAILLVGVLYLVESKWDHGSGGNSNGGSKRKVTNLPLCDRMPAGLGPVLVNMSNVTLEEVDKKFYREVYWGGRYTPSTCIPRHRVAIVVPFRDRAQHLPIFLNHMHPYLMKQQLDYCIYIIEQEGSRDFNRGKLLNVGFRESLRLTANNWQCFVFHDIDLLPLDARNLYSCRGQPKHMSSAVDKLNFQVPYDRIFGGVSALTYEQFTKVNGFSNRFWGWGGEDDDMFNRIKAKKYSVARYHDMSIARYAMMDHKQAPPNPERMQILAGPVEFQDDGLTTLQYEVVEVNRMHLYTHILVNIDESS